MSVSVIIPCLNEEESISECVRRVKLAFPGSDVEVLVADNGSTDSSKELALAAGARVIDERRRGYGSAIMRGLEEASGEYLVIGDADCTYDFEDAVPLVEDLKSGADFAIGNRLAGKAEPGSMPWLHQNLGTPVLTGILNIFYGSTVKDINCGLRAIRRSALPKLRLKSPGMEFASEMVIHASKAGLKMTERPIRYYRRHGGEAKLRTFRDGWRHLRFILLFAPIHFFVAPAFLAFALSIWLAFDPRFGFQVLSSLIGLSAFQVLVFGLLAKAYLWTADSFIVDKKFGSLIERFRLEYGILISLLICLIGSLFVAQWDLKNLIRGSTFIAAGIQLFFSSFLMSIILFKKQDKHASVG